MLLLNPRKNRKGFTLIELIVVVAILAILAAVAVPAFIGMQEKAQKGVDIANASAIAGAINVYNAMSTTKISDKATAQGTLGPAKMWPAGIAAADLADALALVTIDSNTFVATVNNSLS